MPDQITHEEIMLELQEQRAHIEEVQAHQQEFRELVHDGRRWIWRALFGLIIASASGTWAVSSALGGLKVFFADTIDTAIKEERIARQDADNELGEVLNQASARLATHDAQIEDHEVDIKQAQQDSKDRMTNHISRDHR